MAEAFSRQAIKKDSEVGQRMVTLLKLQVSIWPYPFSGLWWHSYILITALYEMPEKREFIDAIAADCSVASAMTWSGMMDPILDALFHIKDIKIYWALIC